MENVLEIAVWVAAGLLVLVLLFVGMAVVLDRTRDLEPKARRGRRCNSSTLWGVFFLAVALLSALSMLGDARPYLPWKSLAVPRWQVWTVSCLLAISGVRLLIVGRRFTTVAAAASQTEGEQQ